ncbi:hypothetical protein Tco_1138741 [Tanacetum coccineum]
MLGLYHTLKEESVKRARSDKPVLTNLGDILLPIGYGIWDPKNLQNLIFWLGGKEEKLNFPLTWISLEMFICLKDHLDAQERVHHIPSLKGDCLEVEEQLHDVEVEAGYTISLSNEEIQRDEDASSEARSSDVEDE